MNAFFEFILYIVIYLTIIFGIHQGYLYLKNTYTTPVKLNNTVQTEKYDELINEIRNQKENDYKSMDEDLSKLIDDEFNES